MPETLQQKIAFLSQASSYPDRPTTVEVIETHMSWVFLTDQYAYKLKKPVIYDYLDFSTLEVRKHFCEEELRLNRRLAASVYLNTVALTQTAGGGLILDGRGPVAEWLIRMRRLSAERSLERCILNRAIPERPFSRLVEKLGLFYAACRPEPITAQQYREMYTKRMIDVIADLSPKEYAMPREVIKDLFRKMKNFLSIRAEMLDARALAGKIVEGHGDLRAEHVYLEDDPVIVDCIEFSSDLRTVDAAFDVAFLALECERLGAVLESERLLKQFFAITGDAPPAALIHFYQTYHACSRARLALWHLKEAQYRNDPKWHQQAIDWLHLGHFHANKISAVS